MKKLSWLIVPLLLALAPVSLLADELPGTRAPSESIAETSGAGGDLDAFEDEFFSEDEQALEVFDPIEPFNRGMFWFNDKLYFYLFKPVAKGFRIVPEPARISVSNLFSNIATPARFANCLLQLKFKDAGTELGRLLINSTVGIAGLFDPAASWGLEKKDEDLGQTFGRYAIGAGPYLVLPVFGPTNLRDGVGRIGDYYLDPVPYFLRPAESLAVKVVDRENELSLDKDTYEGIVKHEIDPYLFVRDAYAQHRAAKIEK